MALTEQMLPDEADEQAPLGRRIGRFSVPSGTLRNAREDVLFTIFAGVIPVKTEANWTNDHMEYVALCPEFEPVKMGDMPPWYRLEIHATDDDIAVRRFVKAEQPQGVITPMNLSERQPTARELRDYISQVISNLHTRTQSDRVSAMQSLRQGLDEARRSAYTLTDPSIRTAIDRIADTVMNFAAIRAGYTAMPEVPLPSWESNPSSWLREAMDAQIKTNRLLYGLPNSHQINQIGGVGIAPHGHGVAGIAPHGHGIGGATNVASGKKTP